MSVITVQPIVLKDVELIIETDDYAHHVSAAQFVPTTRTEQITWQGLSPAATFSEASAPETTWVLNLTFAQDWTTEDSLSEYLFDNAGLSKVAKFQPKKGSGLREFTATVTIAPPPIGGDVKAVAVGTVSMAVDGEPVKGDAV